jgi:hypothetical protein
MAVPLLMVIVDMALADAFRIFAVQRNILPILAAVPSV